MSFLRKCPPTFVTSTKFDQLHKHNGERFKKSCFKNLSQLWQIAMLEQRGTIKAYAMAGKSTKVAFQLFQQGFGELAFSSIPHFCTPQTVQVRPREHLGWQGQAFQKRLSGLQTTICQVWGLDLGGPEEQRHKSCLQRLVFLCKPSITFFMMTFAFLQKAARWVPHLLSDEHKEKHVKMARNFIKFYFEQRKAFLDSISFWKWVSWRDIWTSHGCFVQPQSWRDSQPSGCPGVTTHWDLKGQGGWHWEENDAHCILRL